MRCLQGKGAIHARRFLAGLYAKNGGLQLKQAFLLTIGMITAVIFSANPGNATASSPGSAATASYPRVDPRVVAKAKEWFHRFQTGDIDRSQLNLQVNEELTPKLISQEAATLKPLGSPLAFVFVRSEPTGGAIGYDFAIAFKAARVAESIAFDNAGKIAGIDFRVFLPSGPDRE